MSKIISFLENHPGSTRIEIQYGCHMSLSEVNSSLLILSAAGKVKCNLFDLPNKFELVK